MERVVVCAESRRIHHSSRGRPSRGRRLVYTLGLDGGGGALLVPGPSLVPASCASAHRGLTTAHLTDEGPDTQGLSILTEITLLVNAGAGRRACVLNCSIPSMI